MRGITGRFVLLIATAAVLPLMGYGLFSVQSLRRGTEQSVSLGNQAVAKEVAARIKLYFDNNLRVLSSIGAEIRGTQLEPWQQTQIVRNHVLDFPEFREISIFEPGGRPGPTSRTLPSRLTIPDAGDSGAGTVYIGTPHTDSDGLPTTTVAVPLGQGNQQPGWIVAEISLEELWRTVDKITVGTQGYALLTDRRGTLLAHGNPDDKGLFASGTPASTSQMALASGVANDPASAHSSKYNNARGQQLLAVQHLLQKTTDKRPLPSTTQPERP